MNIATISSAIAKNPPKVSSTRTSSENSADGKTLSVKILNATTPIETINAPKAIVA